MTCGNAACRYTPRCCGLKSRARPPPAAGPTRRRAATEDSRRSSGAAHRERGLRRGGGRRGVLCGAAPGGPHEDSGRDRAAATAHGGSRAVNEKVQVVHLNEVQPEGGAHALVALLRTPEDRGRRDTLLLLRPEQNRGGAITLGHTGVD